MIIAFMPSSPVASGELLKERKGLRIDYRYTASSAGSRPFSLTILLRTISFDAWQRVSMTA
jgi:hypothetical protein